MGTSLSLLSLSLPQLGYGCIELEDSSKKGNVALEEEGGVGEARGGPHTCSVCTCWLTRVVFSFKLVMESLAHQSTVDPSWGKTRDSQGSSGCRGANPSKRKS